MQEISFVDKRQSIISWNIYGILNNDGVSCYVISIVQCLFHCTLIRQAIQCTHIRSAMSGSNVLKYFVILYSEGKTLPLHDVFWIRELVGVSFNHKKEQQDALEFLDALLFHYPNIK